MAAPAWGTMLLEVNWSGDGSTWVDESANVWQCSTPSARGKDYASPLTGHSSAGTLQATLNNTTGRYSSLNASSAITGLILPRRLVRVRSTSPTSATLWTGFLDTIQAIPGRPPTAVLQASGPIITLVNNNISPAPLINTTTGPVATAILTAAGWAGATTVQGGVNPIGNWFVQDKGALDAIREIEETEQGFFWEGADASLNFDGRYNRIINHGTSVATFTDAGATLSYSGLTQDDPFREIFNKITAQVQPMHLDVQSVLWTLAGVTPFLAAGASVTYVATYSASAGAYVSAWVTPDNTDITVTGVAFSDLGISVVKTALSMIVTITNNHATASAQITLLQARGTPYVNDNPYLITSQDTTSQGKYSVRTYPLPAPWFQNGNDAQAACDYFISVFKDPRPVLTLTLQGGKSSSLFAQCVNRNLSDRVTLVATGAWTKLGINQDFFIESIAHSFGANQALITIFTLSPASAAAHYWLLDDTTYSVLGTTTIPGY